MRKTPEKIGRAYREELTASNLLRVLSFSFEFVDAPCRIHGSRFARVERMASAAHFNGDLFLV